MSAALSVVLVTYQSAAEIGPTLEALRTQLRTDDEVVVVDNDSEDATLDEVRRVLPDARVHHSGGNIGFAAGANLGVAATTNPLVLLLNPDAEVLPGCVDALRATAASHPSWGAWQALVALPDGRINSAGGRVHFLGFGWAGAWGEPAAAAPTVPCAVGFASGAALCARRKAWDDVAGFDPSYFMYGEDLDLSLRLVLRGWGVGIVPDAVVRHDYEFERGDWKWFHLERNRWATVLVTYPRVLLLALLPALFAFELALLVVAARGGWLQPKVRAIRAAIRRLPATLRRRRVVQARARVGAATFGATLTADLDGAYFANLAERRPLLVATRTYWRCVLALAARGA